MIALGSAPAVMALGAEDIALSAADPEPLARMTPRVADIQAAICSEFGLTHDALLGADRSRGVARPRQIGMYLCRQQTIRSLPEIGSLFGGRDHTTVLHAVRTVAHLVETDGDIACAVRRVSEQVEEITSARLQAAPPEWLA